jgi:hypothetical protein
VAGVLSLLALDRPVAGCAATKPKPEPLAPLTAKIAGGIAWNQRIEGVQFPLAVTVVKGQFVVAGNDGTVLALDAESGREVWRGSAGAKLSAGVGSDGRFAAVVTREASSSRSRPAARCGASRSASRVRPRRWSPANACSCSASTAACTPSTRRTARKLWSLQRPGDPLTLRKPACSRASRTPAGRAGPRWRARSAHGTCAGRSRSARRAAPTRSSAWPTWWAAGARRRRGLRALVPGGGRLRQRRARHAAWTKTVGGTDGVGGRRPVRLRRRRQRPHHRVEARNGDVAWTSEKLLYRGLARRCRGKTVVFGDAKARCTFCRATTASRCCACRPTAARSSRAGGVGHDDAGGDAQRRLFAFRPE